MSEKAHSFHSEPPSPRSSPAMTSTPVSQMESPKSTPRKRWSASFRNALSKFQPLSPRTPTSQSNSMANTPASQAMETQEKVPDENEKEAVKLSKTDEMTTDVVEPASPAKVKITKENVPEKMEEMVPKTPEQKYTKEMINPNEVPALPALSAMTLSDPADSASCTTWETLSVRVSNGVTQIISKFGKTLLYIECGARGSVNEARIWVLGKTDVAKGFIPSRVTNSWTVVAARVQPLVDWSVVKASSARNAALCVTEPMLMRAKDGGLYVQSTIGKSVVCFKLGASEAHECVLSLVLRTYSSAQKVGSRYTTPVMKQMIAVYEKIIARMEPLFGPTFAKLQGVASTFRAEIQGMAVAVQVRAARAGELAMTKSSIIFVKVKGPFVYIYGVVGEKVVSVKVSIKDLAVKLTEKTTKFGGEAKTRLLVVKDAIQTQVLDASDVAIKATNKLSSKVKVVLCDRSAQATTAGALSGAATMGTTGGVTGVAVGAACGVPAAVFTFGLSIPIGALLGGTAGLMAGGTAGFIGGGAAGHTAHKHQDKISSAISSVSDKANVYKMGVKEKAKGYKVLASGTGGA